MLQLHAGYLTQATADDAGVYSAPNLTVNVGAHRDIPPAAGGTIPVNIDSSCSLSGDG